MLTEIHTTWENGQSINMIEGEVLDYTAPVDLEPMVLQRLDAGTYTEQARTWSVPKFAESLVHDRLL